jgi:hypothetical protein
MLDEVEARLVFAGLVQGSVMVNAKKAREFGDGTGGEVVDNGMVV